MDTVTHIDCKYNLYLQSRPPRSICETHFDHNHRPGRVGSVGSVSASHTVGREFTSQLGHTKDHHKNGTNCLPA